jgi:ammonia channel protein AmtB
LSFSLGRKSTLLTVSYYFSSTPIFAGYGFNPGSALLLTAAESTGKVAALAAVNTSLAAASGAVGALFANLYIEERRTGEYSFDLTVAMNGTLAGLVAVTAPCGTIETWAAICVGLVAGWIYLMGSKLLLKLKLDDAVDAIPVHMFNGMWGLIATGLFSSPGRMVDAFGTDEHVGLFYSLGQGGRSFDGTLLLIQFIALMFVIGWSIGLMLPFFLWLNYMGWFRSDSLEELVGLDMSYHGGTKEANDTAGPDDVKAYSSRKNAMRRRPAEQEDVQGRDEESWDNMTLPSPSETAPERRSAAIAADGTDADDMSSDADAEDMTS